MYLFYLNLNQTNNLKFTIKAGMDNWVMGKEFRPLSYPDALSYEYYKANLAYQAGSRGKKLVGGTYLYTPEKVYINTPPDSPVGVELSEADTQTLSEIASRHFEDAGVDEIHIQGSLLTGERRFIPREDGTVTKLNHLLEGLSIPASSGTEPSDLHYLSDIDTLVIGEDIFRRIEIEYPGKIQSNSHSFSMMKTFSFDSDSVSRNEEIPDFLRKFFGDIQESRMAGQKRRPVGVVFFKNKKAFNDYNNVVISLKVK